MVEDRLVVLSGLPLEERSKFVGVVSTVIDRTAVSARAHLCLDCSQVDVPDDPTVGMLVLIARSAQRRGLRVVLDTPSVGLRHRLSDEGVGYLFAW